MKNLLYIAILIAGLLAITGTKEFDRGYNKQTKYLKKTCKKGTKTIKKVSRYIVDSAKDILK